MSKKFSILAIGLLAVALTLPATVGAADSFLSGPVAVSALKSATGSNSLTAVAARYGWTTNKLISTLNLDADLKLKANGRLLYSCSYQPAPVAHASPQALFPLNQTFLLHSKPGSTKTIYLDFDGMLLSGTAWNDDFNNGNDITAPPWDIDGNPGSFSAQERAIIQEVWFRVAEDYAPYDVDVTTEYAGEAVITRSDLNDQIYGTRVLISPIASQIVPAGGVAYLGIFADVGDYYKPALVFPENLANDPKYIAEACSHEAGHNLNLSHQGQGSQAYFLGQGNWAPIMGAGYYVSVSQWAKGEYQGANNQEDALAIINIFLNYRTNSFGTNFASATPFLGVVNTTNGIINRTGTTNFFSFQTGTGVASITVSNWEVGSDLHLIVGVYDANGVVITNIENPDDPVLGTMPAVVNLPVSNGKYYVSIAGKGYLNPFTNGYSSYGSLGNYSLIITNPYGSSTFVPAPLPPWGTNLSIMNGTDPNGDWLLFVQDDKPVDVGGITNGWFLSLVMASPIGYAADNAVNSSPTNNPLPVAPGTTWQVAVTVTNYGPSVSSNVYITDLLPVGLNLNSTSVSSGTLTNIGSSLYWNVGNLPVNAGAVLNLNFTASSIGVFTNLAMVGALTSDPNPDDDVATSSLVVSYPTQQPVLSAMSLVGGGFQLSITGDGLLTKIQSSTNLVSWVDIFTGIPPFTFTDPATTNYPAKFYRAVLGQ